MTTLPSFAVAPAKINDVLTGTDVDALVGAPIAGLTVTFASNIKSGLVVYGGNFYNVPIVVANIASDGTIQQRSGAPILLLSNDPGLNLATAL